MPPKQPIRPSIRRRTRPSRRAPRRRGRTRRARPVAGRPAQSRPSARAALESGRRPVLPPPLWGRVGVGGREVTRHAETILRIGTASARHLPTLTYKGQGHRGAGRRARVQACAAARQFLRSPRRFRQCASGPRLGGARIWRGAAAGLYGQDSGPARRTRSRSGESAWDGRAGKMAPHGRRGGVITRDEAGEGAAAGRCRGEIGASPASQVSSRSTACCARAAPNSAWRGSNWTPHRPPRPEKSEGGRHLVIKSDFEPKGDQPTAITELVEGVRATTATRCCSASPARARPSPWPR